MFEYKGNVICPSAYLRDVTDPSGYVRQVVKSILFALRRADTRPRLLESLPETINRLAEALNNRQQAVKLTEGALKLAPTSVPLLTTLAALRGRMGEYQKALEAAEAAVGHDGANSHAIVALAFAQSQVGLNESAIATSRRATEIAPYYDLTWLTLGIALDRQGLHDQAIAPLKKACELNPLSARAWYTLGIALDRGEREREALDACRMATQLDPLDAAAWHTLAVAYSRAGRTSEALTAIRRAEVRDESSAAIKVTLTRILLANGEEEEAMGVLSAARSLAAGDPNQLRNVSNCFGHAGLHEQAASAARAALSIDPDHLGARRSLAYNLLELSEGREQAVEISQQLAEETNAVDDWMLFAIALAKSKRHEEAVTAARRARAVDPNHIGARRSLASNLSRLAEDREEAIEVAQELAKETNTVEDWFLLTSVLSHAERPEKAVTAARTTLAINSHHIGARRSLAYNLSKLSDGREEATEVIRQLAKETNAVGDWMQLIAVLVASKRHEEVVEVIRQLAEKAIAVEDWLNLAAVLDRANLHEEAVTAARSALAIDPHDVGAKRTLAYHLSLLPDGCEEAVAIIRQLAEETNSVEDWVQLAAVLAGSKRYEDALTAAQKAVALDAYHVGAKRSLAYHLSLLPNHREKAVEIAQKLAKETNTVEDWIQLAAILSRAKRTNDAVTAARKALAIDAHHVGAKRSLAYHLSLLPNGCEEAVAIIRQLAEETNSVEDWMQLIAALANIERHDEAAAAAQKVLAIDRHHAGARRSLAYHLSRLANREEAIEGIRKRAEETNDVEDWVQLANILGSLGQYGGAMTASQNAIAVAPDHIEAWRALMINADQNGDFELSLQASRRIAELEDPDSNISADLTKALENAQANPKSSKCWHEVAVLYRNAGLVDEAISGARATVEKDPTISSGVAALVEDFLSREPKAIADLLGLMLGPNPTNAHLLHLRGTAKRKAAEHMVAESKAKQLESAISDLQLACKMDPEPPHHWYALGKALADAGSKPTACEAYETAIRKRGGSYPRAEMALKKLLTDEASSDAAGQSTNQQEE